MSRSDSRELPTVFCLPFLGGSAREWTRVCEALREAHGVPLDLPGFGAAALTAGFTVAEMADRVAAIVRERAPSRWLIAGHSMGAKVAAAIARRAEDGADGLGGLTGLVLIAGSPPSPEPMDEAQRQTMLGWFGGTPDEQRREAAGYIDANAAALDDDARALAIDDVLRMQRSAWQAWLASGSREDWTQRIGTLQTPALILAGADDPNLGPAAQQSLMLPHFAHGRLTALAGAKHLLPLERTAEVAAAIDACARDDASVASAAPEPIDVYRRLIISARVGARTRDALDARERPDDPAYVPQTLARHELQALRAIVDRIVPQTDEPPIDIAARIDRQLHDGSGADGWRFAVLPADADAYRGALAAIDAAAQHAHRAPFAALDASAQDALLGAIAATQVAVPAGTFDAAQLTAWFEDCRADAVKIYLGHPRTLARIGYSGIANGGDGMPKTGFARVGIGEREAWEPLVQRARNA